MVVVLLIDKIDLAQNLAVPGEDESARVAK
jgi:hypothetical protein